MQSMVEPTIGGFNQFLNEQRNANLTLVLFDDEDLVPHDRLPIGEVPELTGTTYVPRSMTALLDAIGRTIDELGKKLAAEPEERRPGQVIVAIFTDGLENASSDYDLREVARMIRKQKERYQWTFLFLAAGEDAIATAASMGIGRGFSSQVMFSPKGVGSVSTSVSRKVEAMRRHKALNEKTADLDKALAEIVREEQEK